MARLIERWADRRNFNTSVVRWYDGNKANYVSYNQVELTAVFFETGAMPTPTKSQNLTNCGWGGSFQSYLTHS